MSGVIPDRALGRNGPPQVYANIEATFNCSIARPPDDDPMKMADRACGKAKGPDAIGAFRAGWSATDYCGGIVEVNEPSGELPAMKLFPKLTS
jgi:hypothetical protein